MTQHHRLALTGLTVASLVASVSLGLWAGLLAAPLSWATTSPKEPAGS